MRRVSTKSKLVGSYINEKREGPYSEDKRIRAERRWKRKECIMDEGLKHKRFASATAIAGKSCGNMQFSAYNSSHIAEAGVDEDYKMFLDTFVYQFDVESNSNAGFSDLDVDTVYSSDSGDDLDPQYKTFLENLRKEGNSYIASVIVHNRLDYKRYEDEEEEEEDEDIVGYQQSLETEGEPFDKGTGSDVSGVPTNNCNTELQFNDTDEDYQMFLNSSFIDDEGLMSAQVGSDYKRRISSRNNFKVSNQAFNTPESQCDIDEELAGDATEYQPNLETERGPFDDKPCSDEPKNSDNNELVLDNVDEEYQIFLSSHRIDDDIQSVDEDYQGFLDSYMTDDDCLEFAKVESDSKGKKSSLRVIDGNLVHPWDRNITKTYKGITKTCKGDGDSNSSEPDLILLERDQIGENTPFVFSRIYDSSYFVDETNARDGGHFSSNDHSEFRRRLMENLERPYDQEEYDQFLDEVNLRRQKERHAETRQGVVKSYRIRGVNKSYLESYPDLDKAIAKFKEPHKVLFLLRGFFFWLQNTTHDGSFKPWTDKSCLENLQSI